MPFHLLFGITALLTLITAPASLAQEQFTGVYLAPDAEFPSLISISVEESDAGAELVGHRISGRTVYFLFRVPLAALGEVLTGFEIFDGRSYGGERIVGNPQETEVHVSENKLIMRRSTFGSANSKHLKTVEELAIEITPPENAQPWESSYANGEGFTLEYTWSRNYFRRAYWLFGEWVPSTGSFDAKNNALKSHFFSERISKRPLSSSARWAISKMQPETRIRPTRGITAADVRDMPADADWIVTRHGTNAHLDPVEALLFAYHSVRDSEDGCNDLLLP